MKYLMWDIDGTLILTGGAGMMALVQVIKDYYFLDAFEFEHSLAGRTDSDIIKEAVLQIRGRFLTAEAAGLLIRYHMELPKCLPLCRGRVLKNVLPALQYFDRPDSKYKSCLLTGNTRTGAQHKLSYYNLFQYFDVDRSVFGEASENRSELARIAWQRFYRADPMLDPDDLIFIGDTPNDVRCARTIGSRCLIVLEGSGYRPEDFAAAGCEPWKILPALPDDPAELESLLEEE